MTRRWVPIALAVSFSIAGLLGPFASGPAQEAPSGATEPKASATAETVAEPELKPGIPGLKMVDVRDHKLLWREIDELQVSEQGDRLSVAEFRTKAIEKTVQFLALDGEAAARFGKAADESIAAVRESFLRSRAAGADPAATEDGFTRDLVAAVEKMSAALENKPRHQLFEPDLKKWLLRLAFGPKERKEATAVAPPSSGSPGK